MFVTALIVIVVIALAFYFLYWVNYISPEQIGMPIRHFGRSLHQGSVVAFNGEAGWQADLLSPGRHLLVPFWETMQVHPWVRVPTGTYAIVISQIGTDLETGKRFVDYQLDPKKGRPFDFLADPRIYVKTGGKKGPLLLVLPPDWRGPVHSGAFLVVTINGVFGNPVGPKQRLSVQEALAGYGMTPNDLRVTQIRKGYYGSVESRIGKPPPAGVVATRPESSSDKADEPLTPEAAMSGSFLKHDSYQDPHGFINAKGFTGQQIDPLGPGVYTINRMVFDVKTGPGYEITDIAAGYVAVIKSKVSVIKPGGASENQEKKSVPCGQIGVWEKVLGPGAWVIEKSAYEVIRVPTHVIRGEVTRGSETDNSRENGSESYKLRAIHADTVDNLEATVYYKVLVHINPEDAPNFVVVTGGVDNFFDSLLSALMSDLIRQTTQTMRAVEIVPGRALIIKSVTKGLSSAEGVVTLRGLEEILRKDYSVELDRFILGNVDLQNEIAEAVQAQAVQTQQVETQGARLKAEQVRRLAETAAGQADGARVGERLARIRQEIGPDGARQVLVAEAGQAPIPRVVVNAGQGDTGAETGATAGAILAETSRATEETPTPQQPTPKPEEPKTDN